MVVIFIGWVVYFIRENLDLLTLISSIKYSYIIPLIFLFCLNYFQLSLINKILLESFNVQISYLTSFGLSLSTGFYNILLPFRGGLLVRGYYLKSKFDLPYTSYAAFISAILVLTSWVGSGFGLLSILVIYLTSGMINWVITSAYLLTFVPLGYLVFFTPPYTTKKHNKQNKLMQVIKDWQTIRSNRKTVIKIGVISTLRYIFTGLSAVLYFWAFGIDIQYFEGLFIAITSSSIIGTLTPAGIGMMESLMIFSAQILGISTAESLPVSLLGRAIYLAVLLCLGSISSYLLYKTVFIRPPSDQIQ